MSAAVLILVFAAAGAQGGVFATQIDMPSMDACKREAAKFTGFSSGNTRAYCVDRANKL